MDKLKEKLHQIIVFIQSLKFVWSNPFVFAEEKDIEKLKRLSSEGWHIKKIWLGGALYIFEKEEPRSLQYYFDTQPNPTDEYYQSYQQKGFEVVDTSNSLHLFFAPAGMTKVERNVEKLQGRFRNESFFFGKYSLIILIGLLFTFLAWFFVEWELVKDVLIGTMSILGIGFVVTFVPYISYKWRIKKLQASIKTD